MYIFLACRKSCFSFACDSLPLQQGCFIFMTILLLCEVTTCAQRITLLKYNCPVMKKSRSPGMQTSGDPVSSLCTSWSVFILFIFRGRSIPTQNRYLPFAVVGTGFYINWRGSSTPPFVVPPSVSTNSTEHESVNSLYGPGVSIPSPSPELERVTIPPSDVSSILLL